MDTPASMDEDLHDLLRMPGIEQEHSWENLSIDLEPETFADANTPTGPQHYLELRSPLPESGDDHFATSFFQPRTFPDIDHSYQQNIFQDLNESLGPQNSTKAAKAAPQERLLCERLGCNSSFTRQRDLHRHVISRHVQLRSYKCAITGCDGTFSRLDKLREHQRRKHAAELPSLRRDAPTATTRAEHDHAQSLPNFEYIVRALNMEIEHPLADGSGHSIPKQMYRISYQGPQSDRESSTPATEYSYGLIEESSGVSDLNSSGGSISTRSRSPCKTITSNNRDTAQLSSRGQDDHTRRRFACPYQKHDPRTYNIRRYRACASSGWDTLPRVKEHLYRCHMAPIHCSRCWAQFKNQEEFWAHMKATCICESRPRPALKGISPEIEARLRSRKKSFPRQSDEQKWKEMYSLLFPNEEVPNPYYSEPNDFENALPSGSTELTTNKVYPQRPLRRVLQNLQEELLQDFRSRLEIAPVKEGAPLDATSRSHALSVLEECQAHVFGSYQASIAAGDDMHVTTQADFLDGADIDMTFEQGLPDLSFDEDVCADVGYGV